MAMEYLISRYQAKLAQISRMARWRYFLVLAMAPTASLSFIHLLA